MKHKKKYKKYFKTIIQIENSRKKNNVNWMNLLRLSFKHNPKETKKIVKEIFRQDKTINKLVKNLVK